MINLFHNMKYCIWNLDLSNFSNKEVFEKELNQGFDISSKLPTPPESNGSAYSTDLEKFTSFSDFLNFISPSLNQYFPLLHKGNKKIVRSWANRMHKDSFGSIHSHGSNLKVLIFYYKVPKDSSDLILINPKYKIYNLLNPYSIPENDKLYIKVTEGMCILHDGDILHAVSKHNSLETRDAIIIEYNTTLK